MVKKNVGPGHPGKKEMKKRLLEAVPKKGRLAKAKLLEEFSWAEQTFLRLVQALVDDGLIGIGPGRGGTLYRVDPEHDRDKRRERDYYELLLSQILGSFADGYEDCFVQETAYSGKRKGASSGKWTRPDFTLVGMNRSTILQPSVFLDVVTFEVKRVQDASVLAVHEALQHRSAATHSWVVIAIPSKGHEEAASFCDRLERIRTECVSHGIGLALFRRYRGPIGKRWVSIAPASRADTDPRDVDEFLTRQLQIDCLDHLRSWYHDVGVQQLLVDKAPE